MSNKYGLWVLAILGLCLVVSLGFLTTCNTANNRPLLADVTEETQTQAQVKYYNVAFKKDVESEKIAGIWVLVEDTGRDLYRLSFQITHEDTLKLKSASLEFNNVYPASALMLSTPGAYPMPSLKFESIVPSSGGAIISVDDFGVLETGTVNFEFYLNADGMNPLPHDELNVAISLGLRENGRDLVAKVPLEIRLP